MPRTFIVDSTNTSRLVKRLFVIDSTNTARQVKRVFYVDSTNTSRLVYTAAVTMTMVAGQSTVGGDIVVGYQAGSYGTLSPTQDPAHNTVTAISWGGPSGAVLQLSISAAAELPFPYVYSLAINGGTPLLGSNATFSYTAPNSSWLWSYPGFTYGDTYTCVLTL
jgi:hypothetical protein